MGLMTLFPLWFLQHLWCIGQKQERPKLVFLPPWLSGMWPGSWGYILAKAYLWKLSPDSYRNLLWSLRPQVHTYQWNLGRDLRNQENLERFPSGTGRTWAHQNRPIHQRTEEGLDHPLGSHQYSWIWILGFGYSGESCDTFQTRFVELDECAVCNWVHEKSMTLVTTWCAEFISRSQGCFHLV
jgi:hypothetical protein